MSDEAFRLEVQNLKAAHFERFTQADDSLDEAEARALTKVSQLLPFVSKASEAVRCFQILNAARRRTSGAASASLGSATTIVNISLPQVARVAMLTDHNKQVIEVDGRPLITMPAKQLVQQVTDMQATRLLEAKVPKTLSFQQTKVSESLGEI